MARLTRPPMLTALFGIEDGSLNLAVNLLILVLVIVWLALVYWTWADARRRIEDPVLVATAAVAALLLPFFGSAIYSILRPPEFLSDARERDLETRAAELRLRQLAAKSCPRCEHPIEISWLRCPECQQRLKDPCRSCGRPVDPRWSICPHCESPVAETRTRAPRQGAAPAARRTRPAADGQQQRPTRSEAERRAAAQQKRRAAGPKPAAAPRASSASPPSNPAPRRAQPTRTARPDADPPTTTN